MVGHVPIMATRSDTPVPAAVRRPAARPHRRRIRRKSDDQDAAFGGYPPI